MIVEFCLGLSVFEIELVFKFFCILVFRLFRILISEWVVEKCGIKYFYGICIYEISVINLCSRYV